MIVRELLTRIGYEVDRKTESRAKRSFSKLQKAAGKLGIALSAGAVALGFKKILDAASDVEETMNVVTTAFDDQADAVLAWAQAAGDASGRSQFAMREYAATLGAVVGPTLDNAEATADLSTNMAQLAVDLASFFNATDEDALIALRAGLIGSSEPLLRFGVDIRQANLEAFALAEGLGKTFKQMTAAEKTMLRYRFIMDQTVKAQGDAEKTSAGFANQMKRLMGNLNELAVALGKELLPGAATFLQTLNEIIKNVAGPLTSALRLLIAPIKLVATTIAGLVIGLLELDTVSQVVFSAMLAAIIVLKAPFIITFAIIGGLILAALLLVEDLWLGLTEGKGVIAGVAGEFMRWFEETDSVFRALEAIIANVFDFWIERIFGVPDAGTQAFGALRDFVGSVFDWMTEKVETFLAILVSIPQAIATAFSDLGENLRRLIAELPLAGSLPRLLGNIGDFFGQEGLGAFNIADIRGPAAGGGVGDVSSRQEININVSAPGGDAAAIAGAVAPAAGRAAAEGNRRTAQQLLVGGAS